MCTHIDIVSSLCRYAAPETVPRDFLEPDPRRPDQYTRKVDVFSFAIIMWEMASGRTAYSDITTSAAVTINPATRHSFHDVLLYQVKVYELRPKPLPVRFGVGFCKLIKDCWHQDPTRRPTFGGIMVRALSRAEAQCILVGKARMVARGVVMNEIAETYMTQSRTILVHLLLVYHVAHGTWPKAS
jgi:serine/threonine protein kinase